MKKVVTRPIKDYCIGIYDGPHATPQESEDGPIFLGIKNITNDGQLNFSETRHVSEQDFPKWTRRVTPQTGDVVFTYEATLHRYALIPDGFRGCLGRRVALVRPNPSQVDSRYLLYFFLSKDWRATVESNVITGATVDRIPLERFPAFPVALPGHAIQKKIADILSAYDDLIENNRRRMTLLEDAARQVYQEWFVRLRFPGYEHSRIVDGVPEGWEKGTVGHFAEVKSGYAFKSSNWQSEGNPVIKIANILGDNNIDIDSCQCIDDNVAEKASKFSLNSGDLLIAMTGATVGKVGIMPRSKNTYYLNQRVGRLSSRLGMDVSPLLLSFFNQEDAQAQIINYAAGAAQPNISGGQIEAIKLLIPEMKLVRLYLEFAVPLFEQRLGLVEQNQKLRTARDLLLPKLMSGEISV